MFLQNIRPIRLFFILLWLTDFFFEYFYSNNSMNKRPMGLGDLLNNNLAMGQSSKRWNWASFCPTGSGFWDNGWFSKFPYSGMKLACLALAKIPEVAHTLFPPGAQNCAHSHSMGAVSEILADFQNCHISIGMNSRSCTYTLFQRVEIELYGQWFPRYGQFSKLTYLGMKLGKWPKFQKLHIYNVLSF